MEANQAFVPNQSISRPIWASERSALTAASFIADKFDRLQHYKIFIIVWTLFFILAGIAYAKILPPEYIASTQILLQPRFVVNDGPENVRHFQQQVIDSDQCETELQILTSQRLLYQVFNARKLVDAPEIKSGANGLWAFIGLRLDQIQGHTVQIADSVEAFNRFRGRVRARRLGLSYVIEILYRAHSAEQATNVVNAIASTYAAYRLRGVFAREQRRGAYLESRLTNLQAQIMAVEAGSRFGVIPSDQLPDADVRLLGPANNPLEVAYPKWRPISVMMANLGLVSGTLIVLLSSGVTLRDKNRRIPVRPKSPTERKASADRV